MGLGEVWTDAISMRVRAVPTYAACVPEWITHEDLWPQNRSLKMFRQWFGIEYRSMIWDMDDKTPLEIEDWGEFDEDDESDQASQFH